MKVLELYSGIGGMHMALKESKTPGDVLASVDINTNANAVYKHNFSDIKLLNKNIQSLSPEFINKLGVDTILMSPPCQPFTRNGLKGDVTDPRTCSFTYILSILHNLKVEKILMENVMGFEKSQMHENFIEILKKCEFNYREFILTPTEFGVPNTRHRYYCIAKKKPAEFLFESIEILTKLPGHVKTDPKFAISDILEETVSTDYLLPDKILLKRAKIMDICYSYSTRSCCFTKAYGRYAEGTGSVFSEKNEKSVSEVFNSLETLKEGSEQLEQLKTLNLRYFTPLEVSRLMSFPEYFSFPSSLTNKQKYMLLGNSINVKVVSELIKLLNS